MVGFERALPVFNGVLGDGDLTLMHRLKKVSLGHCFIGFAVGFLGMEIKETHFMKSQMQRLLIARWRVHATLITLGQLHCFGEILDSQWGGNSNC